MNPLHDLELVETSHDGFTWLTIFPALVGDGGSWANPPRSKTRFRPLLLSEAVKVFLHLKVFCAWLLCGVDGKEWSGIRAGRDGRRKAKRFR